MLLLKLAWLNLWRNPRRTFIAGGSLFFAVILAVVMRASTLGIYDNLIFNFVSFSSGYLEVHQQGYHEDESPDLAMNLDTALLHRLEAEAGVTAVLPRLRSFVLAAGAGQAKGALLMGVVPSLESRANGLQRKLSSGTFPASDSQCTALMGQELAARLKLRVGDTLVLIGQGYHASTAAGKFRLGGLMQFGSPELNQRLIYLPLDHAQNLLGTPDMATSYAVQIQHPEALESLSHRLRKVLDTSTYELMTWKELYPELDQFITADSGGHVIMSGVLYMVISFGLLGALLMMARERTHEFGMFIALGLKKSRIAFMLLLESLMLSVLGCAAGLAGGWLFIRWFYLNPIQLSGRLKEMYLSYGIEPIISLSTRPDVFYVQAMVVLGISVLLVLAPIVKVMQLQPVEALNS